MVLYNTLHIPIVFKYALCKHMVLYNTPHIPSLLLDPPLPLLADHNEGRANSLYDHDLHLSV